jgi:hypothetical protein
MTRDWRRVAIGVILAGLALSAARPAFAQTTPNDII